MPPCGAAHVFALPSADASRFKGIGQKKLAESAVLHTTSTRHTVEGSEQKNHNLHQLPNTQFQLDSQKLRFTAHILYQLHKIQPPSVAQHTAFIHCATSSRTEKQRKQELLYNIYCDFDSTNTWGPAEASSGLVALVLVAEDLVGVLCPSHT